MTTCETIQPRLTAYLDGELADDHGSVVRGHLRECAVCRQIARDEAALRDGLRTLAPVDPPASLWAGVQAQLAAAEVADARKPRWRRTLAQWTQWVRVARWMPAMPTMSQLAAGGLVAAAAIGVVYVRAHRLDEPAQGQGQGQGQGQRPAMLAATDTAPEPPRPSAPEPPRPDTAVSPAGDVTADLLAEPTRTTASYGQVIEELMTLASSARGGWSDDRRAAFDAKVAALHDGIARAGQAHAQQRAQRALIRYLQGAVVRDDVMLASGGIR